MSCWWRVSPTRALDLYGGSTWDYERAWEAQARKALEE